MLIKKLTVIIEIIIPTSACFEKLWREWSEVLNHILQMDISRIRARLAEKVKIGSELKCLAE